jgi:hypothetical protein
MERGEAPFDFSHKVALGNKFSAVVFEEAVFC